MLVLLLEMNWKGELHVRRSGNSTHMLCPSSPGHWRKALQRWAPRVGYRLAYRLWCSAVKSGAIVFRAGICVCQTHVGKYSAMCSIHRKCFLFFFFLNPTALVPILGKLGSIPVYPHRHLHWPRFTRQILAVVPMKKLVLERSNTG